MYLIVPFLLISVDNEKIKLPVMEGIDALVAVSGALYITALYQLNCTSFVDSFSYWFVFYLFY